MSLSTRLAIAMVALVVLTAAVVGTLINLDIRERALPRALDGIDTHTHLLAIELADSVNDTRADVLTQGRGMDGLVAAHLNGGVNPADGTPEALWRERLASRFVAELTAKPVYAQFRLIGIADGGREIVRVDRLGPNGTVRVVPEAELRRVGDADYFKATIARPAGQVYAAPIAYDHERDALDGARVPTLRVAAPVMAPDGDPFGVMVVDVDMTSGFAQLRDSAIDGGSVYVVNALGDFLVHPDASREFGFERGIPVRFADDFPGPASIAGSGAQRVVQDRTEARFGIGSDTVRLVDGPPVTVIEAVPYALLRATNGAGPSILGAVVVLLGALPLAVLLARSLSRPLVQMTAAIEQFSHDEPFVIPTAATGEIGVLARAFARMAAEVREKTAALRKEVDEHSRTSDRERLFSAAVESSDDAIITNTLDGIITGWNRGAERLFGFSAAEAIGRDIGIMVPEDRNDEPRALLDRIRRDEMVRQYDTVRVSKDGRRIHVSLSISPVKSPSGEIVGAARIARDITERKRADEQLRQSQKMEAVGQLTGGVAHDFNNMLTVITGTVELLAEEVADKPQLSRVVKLISDAADRGAELTRQLLAFARRQPLHPRVTDISALMVESTKLVQRTLSENVEVELKVDPQVWSALVDPTQLTSALLNLAVNARDAMPNGGKLTIEAKNDVLDGSYSDANAEVEPGDYVMIAVSDTGVGIPAANLNKIFEPFFSTKEVGKGTGLGLSMVYGFVKQSGGHIKVYSEEGQGTAFRLYLPRSTTQSDQPAAETPVPPVEGGNETILVVEDDPAVRAAVTARLQSLGYLTITVANAAEALAIVDRGVAFDLLFTDVVMPGGMNGRQLADAVVQRRPGMKILFTSGYTQDAVIHHGRLDAGVLLLAKPYRRSELARMIRAVLDTDHRPQEVPSARQATS